MEQNGKVGFIDKAGKQIIPPRYDGAQPFSEGLAAVRIKGKYGYIDKTGKMVIPPQFEHAGPFSEGLALINSNGNQCGYIDKSGKLVINGEEFVVAGGFPKVWLRSWEEKTKNTVLSIRPANSSSSRSSIAWVIFPRDWLRLGRSRLTGPATWRISIKGVKL